VQVREGQLLDQGNGGREVALGLAREADEDVGAEPEPRERRRQSTSRRYMATVYGRRMARSTRSLPL
jgi:hypothetical protein